MTPWRKLLEDSASRIITLDGGMGTTVEDRGVDILNSLWGCNALTNPEGREVNDQIHRDFRDAGAEVLIANTHNAALKACRRHLEGAEAVSSEVLSRIGDGDLDARAVRLMKFLNEEAVASIRRVAPVGGPVAVLAGLGSVEGAYAEETALNVESATPLLRPQYDHLRTLEVDGIIFETLTTRTEMQAVARMVRDDGYVDYSVGLTCTKQGVTNGGVTMDDVARIFAEHPPQAAFIQCTRFDYVHVALEKLAATLRDSTVVLGVYANDGRKYGKGGWSGERTPPATYVLAARRWVDLGARILGGCCGTRPDHVQAVNQAFSDYN